MRPWLRPIYDNFEKYVSPSYVQKLIKDEIIEICPLAYMRGRTFDNCIIIADEMQNSTESQMKMILTRIGFNSKFIIDICNEVDGEEGDISLLDSVSPAIILDKTDENLFFVLMPMRI